MSSKPNQPRPQPEREASATEPGIKQRNRLSSVQLERIVEWLESKGDCQQGTSTHLEQIAEAATIDLGLRVTASNIRSALERLRRRDKTEPNAVAVLAQELARMQRIVGVEPIDRDRLDRLASTG